MEQQGRRLGPFLAQLRRRHVVRVALAYVVVGYLVIEAADVLVPALDLPESAIRLVTALVILGFPIALGLAWAFDITPDGVVRTPLENGARRAEADAGSTQGTNGQESARARTETGRTATSTPPSLSGDSGVADALALPEGPVIAVLPFTNMSGDPADEVFTDGITEDLITGLSRFTHLFVIARNTTFRYKGRSVDVREIGRELGARYVLEGRIRKAAHQLRVNAQLLEARTGTHLWAEIYDRDLTAGEVFAVQDEITSRVVATLADPDGVLTRSAAPAAAAKPTDSLDAYEAVLRTFSYWRRQTPAEHAEVRAALERAVEIDPQYSNAWACLAIIYLDELRVGFNPLPEPPSRIMAAAHRAVEAGPTNPLAHLALAQAQFFCGDIDAFFPTADQAIRLNPNDSTALATVGMLIGFAGEWERGVTMLEKAVALNPHHPGWYHLPMAFYLFREGDYQAALKAALQVNMPGYYPAHMILTAIHGQLGREAEARAAAGGLLEVSPDFVENGPARIARWQRDPHLRATLLEALRKAGLPVREPDPAPAGPEPR